MPLCKILNILKHVISFLLVYRNQKSLVQTFLFDWLKHWRYLTHHMDNYNFLDFLWKTIKFFKRIYTNNIMSSAELQPLFANFQKFDNGHVGSSGDGWHIQWSRGRQPQSGCWHSHPQISSWISIPSKKVLIYFNIFYP